jgi:hypothetical protein
MAENKTQPTDADVEALLATVSDSRRRDDARAVIELMSRVTGEPPVLWGSAIVGFGSQHYKGKSGREGEWMIVGVSPRKAALTIYGVYNDYGPADPLYDQLGPHTTGKGCLYLKRLSDVDPAVLESLIRNAWTHPAIAGPGA